MPLNLYRRHRQDCVGGHTEESRSGELEERSKKWKRCDCQIYAAGTLARKFKRHRTGKFTWEEAKAVAAAWESARSWESQTIAPIPTASKGTGRITLAEATKAYLATRESSQITTTTLAKYKTLIKKLTAYANSKGYVMLDQITSADIDLFYSGWKLGARAKGKALGTMRHFFRFCARRKWVSIDASDPKSVGPVSSDLKPPIGAGRAQNKHPFTDEELKRIYAACDRIGTVNWKNGRKSGMWSGQDARDFLDLLLHTGLRISDAGLFEIGRLRGNEIYLRAKKNGGDVCMWVPDTVRDMLLRRSKVHGLRPFLTGESDRLETVTDLWRRRLNKVFDLAGKFNSTPTPHRCRHTFARLLLQRGVPASDVADLLGDDEATVKQHYARWVPERQARLTAILQDAFGETPTPDNVIKMPKTGTK
jgi:integrase